MKKCCGVHALIIAIGITILALLLGGGASAATNTVNASGGGDYTRIQDAINNASAGDTILVYGGIYYENVNVTKKLILRGIGNPVVNGDWGTAITLAEDGITLEGFTATGTINCCGSQGIVVISNNNTLKGNNATGNRHIGISLSFSNNNTLIDNNANSNDCSCEGGVELDGFGFGISLVSSNNNTLIGNNASNNNIGIYLSSSSNNTMIRNIMKNNQNNFGITGTIDSHYYNNIDISNTVNGKPIFYLQDISDKVYNTSINAGTFYCINCNNITVRDSIFADNLNGVFFWKTNNSKIESIETSGTYYGIHLSSSSNNNLNNNNASIGLVIGSGYGIYLDSSSNNTLIGNDANSNGVRVNGNGISLFSSSNNNLRGNNASNNYNGIILSSSNNNTLKSNNASENAGGWEVDSYFGGDGILLYFSNNNTLTDNIASYNHYGISMSSSSNNTLSGNMMTGNPENFNLDGDNDSDFDNNIDKGNLVDGKPVYYMIKASDTTYNSSSNAGTFYCISCVNVTVKNLDLNNNGKGIYFRNTSQSKIQNVTSSSNLYGISLYSSSNNTLKGNNASNNLRFCCGEGIYFRNTSQSKIRNETSSSNRYGISLSSSSNNKLNGNIAYIRDFCCSSSGIWLSSSSNNTLISNNASNNNIGIYLESSSDNTLSGNDASNNFLNENRYGYGIHLYNSSKNTLRKNIASKNWNIGIFLYSSSSNMLIGNNANSNVKGISLETSDINTLIKNIASNNWNIGIYLGDSNFNNIYNNIFNNTKNFEISYSNYNAWNTTKTSGINIIAGPYLGGNFWANPKGTGFSQTCRDVNSDGICDKSYTLDENNIDYLPLTKDKIPPKSVRNLKNVSYEPSYIKWTWKDPKDSDFDKVRIYINNKYVTSVLKGVQFYKAKNLYANRSYKISTRTADKSGNINLTWKNNTARTKPDLKPPMNVTNLKNITYARNYINWTWKDPKDIDFNKVMVFIDSKFKKNVSKGKRFYNATNFNANTRHTISTLTVDMNGNINKTWTNHSAWTAK